MLGKPCIKGSRMTVEFILKWLAAGRTFADSIASYLDISEDDIRAASAFAAEAVNANHAVAAE